MKLKQLGANQTEVHFKNGTIVLFSYETPVAAILSCGDVVKTNKKWSKTTSRHISNWFRHDYNKEQSAVTAMYKAFNVEEVDQSVLDNLIGEE